MWAPANRWGVGQGRQAQQLRSQGLWLLSTRWNSGQWQALCSKLVLAPSLPNSAHSLGMILTPPRVPCPKVLVMPAARMLAKQLPTSTLLFKPSPLCQGPLPPFSSSMPTPPGSLLQCLAQSRINSVSPHRLCSHVSSLLPQQNLSHVALPKDL